MARRSPTGLRTRREPLTACSTARSSGSTRYCRARPLRPGQSRLRLPVSTPPSARPDSPWTPAPLVRPTVRRKAEHFYLVRADRREILRCHSGANTRDAPNPRHLGRLRCSAAALASMAPAARRSHPIRLGVVATSYEVAASWASAIVRGNDEGVASAKAPPPNLITDDASHLHDGAGFTHG